MLLGAVEGEIRYPPAVLGAWKLCAYAQPLAIIADKYAVKETLVLCAYAQPLTAIADKYAVRGTLELCAYTQPLITIVGKRAVRGILELCVYAQTLTAIADKYAVNETLELCAYAQPLTAIADKYAVRECLGVAFPHRKKPNPLAHYERTNTPTRTLRITIYPTNNCCCNPDNLSGWGCRCNKCWA